MSDEHADVLFGEIGQVADDADLGLIRFDANLRVQSANVAAHEVLDRRPGSLIGRSAMETFVDHRLESMVRAAGSGRSGVHASEGTDRASIVVRAHPAVAGGVWVTLQDVTELQHLRRIRSEFIDNVSHELRTPLASVRLLTEMLMDDLADAQVPDRVRERVATIDIESGHLVQMVNELLDLSRMEQYSTHVRDDVVALPPLVEASLGRLQTFADRQGVVLIAQLPPDLPLVRGDEERLDQLLMNLVHNAIKFSSEGGKVTITADEHPDAAVISVRDEGVGIPAVDQDRVFERFYKADRARQRGLGGTGLGLAIARHIAEAHGGRIWLESTEGVGSTFSFSVPFA
jgi:two-component system, OmpR family, phosphate regulon sensor histidine kinase PhoR